MKPYSRLNAAIPIIMYIHYGVAVTSKELGCEKVKAKKISPEIVFFNYIKHRIKINEKKNGSSGQAAYKQ